MPLSDYRTRGRSGLVVSPLALRTMTFGTARWGAGEAASRKVFEAYLDAGGNFIAPCGRGLTSRCCRGVAPQSGASRQRPSTSNWCGLNAALYSIFGLPAIQ